MTCFKLLVDISGSEIPAQPPPAGGSFASIPTLTILFQGEVLLHSVQKNNITDRVTAPWGHRQLLSYFTPLGYMHLTPDVHGIFHSIAGYQFPSPFFNQRVIMISTGQDMGGYEHTEFQKESSTIKSHIIQDCW